jgi:hypothetical protein
MNLGGFFYLGRKKQLIMTIEQIEHFMKADTADSARSMKIFFKTRNTVEGIFIKAPDYLELKKRNFWRIVTVKKMEDYLQSKDINHSRIFNGNAFTRLASNT